MPKRYEGMRDSFKKKGYVHESRQNESRENLQLDEEKGRTQIDPQEGQVIPLGVPAGQIENGGSTMKKITVFLVLLSVLFAFGPAFGKDIDKNSIPAPVQDNRNTGFVAFTTDRVSTNKASAPVNLGQYLPDNLVKGRVYVYGGEAVFGRQPSGSTGLNASSTIPTGYTVASGSYFEITGKKPYEDYHLYADVAFTATGPVTFTFAGEGE